MNRPKPPKVEPVKLPDPPPTVDQAQKNAEEQDRLRRRKGRAAYIFGGASATQAPVGQKNLTGQ